MLQLHLQQVEKYSEYANIFRYSIEQHNSLPEMIGWGLFGFTLAYFRLFII